MQRLEQKTVSVKIERMYTVQIQLCNRLNSDYSKIIGRINTCQKKWMTDSRVEKMPREKMETLSNVPSLLRV